MMRATDFFAPEVVDKRTRELKAWLDSKGVRDLEKVPLYSEQLEQVRSTPLPSLCRVELTQPRRTR